MSVTTQLSEPLVGLQYDDLPPDAVNAAKNAILDTLGCMLAGAQTEDMPAIVQQLTGDELPEQSTVIGFGKKTSVHYALLLNATMGHAVELDDVHKEAKSHAGTVVVPAALSYGEHLGVSGKELLLSVIIGYEVMLRIGSAINASEHRLKGWHATGTCGTFGAAAAIAKLEQFDLKQFVSALGLAGTQSSGLWAFTADGANCKKFHAGSAASSGYMAATLTRGGLTGPAYILEAEDGGLFRASSNHFHFDVITRDIGKKYEITRVSHKPYACCRSMHPSIQAALTLKDKGVEPESIKRVKVKTYEVAKVQCGFTSSPKNVNEARFSIPYGIAVAFYDGEALLEQFTEDRITDRKVLELAAKVEIEADETFSKVYPRKWGCQLEIETYDGQHLVEVVDDAKGDPRYPLSRLELQEKFMALAGRVIGREKAVLVMSLVDRLEKVEHIGELIELCSE
ncbi:2-methylcitrate dehydratase PrpD [Melghiribacillus thermohalophilus]|uniref:2-methylcitrate dehydratase PrpD n=1 Tax=Melghiribacillus thermohalophilus TaxID=1324956 RepID=A0A4R3MYG8_9BACI|nr:MmgE/PrpD family protein [Melghiribacillus thermohalophilus]TCT21710.1 2-methylcitrate dehydratase PrpD [Melghiribacillus thermohalophilus]